MAMPWNEHVDGDILERYALGRLAEEDSATVEMHLLICSCCRAKVEQTAEFASALRSEVKQGRPMALPAHSEDAYWDWQQPAS